MQRALGTQEENDSLYLEDTKTFSRGSGSELGIQRRSKKFTRQKGTI